MIDPDGENGAGGLRVGRPDSPTASSDVRPHNPLNTNAAEGSNQLLPAAPLRALSGDATYEPMNVPGGEAGWTWQRSRS